jgi:signal transduction histidine kinase
VHLAVRDDGIREADPGQGSGLIGLRDRIEAVGGTLDISADGSGTTLLRIAGRVAGSSSWWSQASSAGVISASRSWP